MTIASVRRLWVAELAREVIASSPAPLRQAFGEVVLVVKEGIDAEDLARGATAELRGYYYAAEDASEDGCEDRLSSLEEVPPRIVLIASNLAPTLEAVGEVLAHELGHHLGFSEVELTEGLGLV